MDARQTHPEAQSQEQDHGTPRHPHTGRLAFYHADAKGSGRAMRLELRLNRAEEDRYDCFFLEMARQQTAATGERGRTVATFDWDRKVVVKLDFFDVCELLTVLEGRAPNAGGQRNGLYHQSGNTNTLIAFRKDPERAGYSLDISRKDQQGNQVFKEHIILSEAEATGLRCVMQAGLFYLAFHGSVWPALAARPPARPAMGEG